MRRLDAEIAEGRGHAVHPQANVTFSMPQPIDHQAGLRATVDRGADFLLRYFEAGMKPPGGIRHGLDGGFRKRQACPCRASPNSRACLLGRSRPQNDRFRDNNVPMWGR